MPRRLQILVIGNSDDGCTTEHEKAAYEIGRRIAEAGAVLISGGLGGVMRASCRGSHDAGGLAVGILPQENHAAANEFCDIVIPTGMGLTRDFVDAMAADGIIIVGGGAGTLSEACAGYMHGRPMVAVRGTGGVADQVAGEYLDHRRRQRVGEADSAEESVRMILEMISAQAGSGGTVLPA